MEQQMLEDGHMGDTVMVQEPELEPEITLHALTGWITPKTMCVSEKMGSHEVMVLIDNESTHNFISNHLASTLRLPVIPTESFHVRVANGEGLTCQGHYDKVRVELQGTTFYLTLFSLPLITGLDLVLGVQWLEMLGSVVCNWKQLTMDFVWESQDCRLQGVDVQTIQAASPTEMAKEFHRGHALFAVCFQLTEDTTPPALSINDDNQNMHCLLQDYNLHMRWITVLH